jgi:hypothetical protein
VNTHVEHTVMFWLDEQDEDSAVYGYERGYARLTGVTVHLRPRGAEVWAGGRRCRKDGQIGKGWGVTCVSISELPEAEKQKWIDRANRAVAFSVEGAQDLCWGRNGEQ